MVIGGLIGIHISALSLAQTIAIALLLSFCLTSIGLAIGSYIESLEGFQLIVSFVVFPSGSSQISSFSDVVPFCSMLYITALNPTHLPCIGSVAGLWAALGWGDGNGGGGGSVLLNPSTLNSVILPSYSPYFH